MHPVITFPSKLHQPLPFIMAYLACCSLQSGTLHKAHRLDELLESTVNRRSERLDVLVEVNG